ncbi:MAG: GNAT family N-acetyltransferase [Calditrichia bacterium]
MANIQYKVLVENEAQILQNVAPDVFDNPVNMEWTEEFLADSRHHISVAIDGDLVVGMATAVDYVHPDKPRELWINEVGVSPNWQQCGIGKKLMQTLFEYGRSIGCKEAWVLTDQDNAPARKLYQSVNGEEELSVYVTFKL